MKEKNADPIRDDKKAAHPPGLAPWTSIAVAGVLLTMLGVRTDPPEVHRREIHRRSQFAPDLATWIRLASLHLRQYLHAVREELRRFAERCSSTTTLDTQALGDPVYSTTIPRWEEMC